MGFTGCNEKKLDSTPRHDASVKVEQRNDALILKENGDLRVKPLPGMDLVKDAPKAPKQPTVSNQESNNDLKINLPPNSVGLSNAKPVKVVSGQSPMTRATIRTHAMEEMNRRNMQGSEHQK